MRIKFGILIISCVFVLTACSNTKQLADYSFPFSFDGNRLVMTASIDGSEGKFVFDTGIGGIISSTPIKTLQEIKGPYESYYLLGVVHHYKTYAVSNITVNSASFPVSTFLQKSDTKIFGFDGIIGLSVFKGYFVEVSFTDKQIRLYKAKPQNYRNKVSIYFDYQSCPYIQCNVDGINTPFYIDTGSPNNIVFPLPSANCIDRKKYQKILSLDDDYESYRVNINYYDDGFRVYKNLTGNSNPFSLLDLGLLYSRSGNLGVDYLKWFDFVIDNRGPIMSSLYFNNRSLIARISPGRKGAWYLSGRPNARYNKYGIDGWNRKDGRLYVSSLIENSPAHLAGIKPGTEITEINNRGINKYSLRQLDTILIFSKKELALKCLLDNKEQVVILK